MIYDLQKASMWKRISAFLFDMILLSILAVFFVWILSSVLGHDKYMTAYTDVCDRYAAEYGVTDEMILSASNDTATPEQTDILNRASEALSADPEAMYALEMVANLTTVMVTFGLLVGFLILEFLVPMLFGNGQTLGKKIFGVGVMLVDGVRISSLSLFVRTVLGKFAVETMPFAMCFIFIWTGFGSPVFFLIGGALLIAQLLILIFSRENALLHDKMAATVTVDLASQMIFNTREELLEYKKQQHARKVAQQS